MDKDGNIAARRTKFGKRISSLREKQGLSQYKFSEMIGMDRTYLIGVEKGRRNVSIDNIIRIADGLDISLSELFKGVN